VKPPAGPRRPPARAKPRPQYGALPYRTSEGVEILLITSRETGRWVIPKGWPMKGRSASATAAREALEEAGLIGEIGKRPLGAYVYMKFLKSGEGRPCKVRVFAFRVVGQKEVWREKGQRTTRWFAWSEAAGAVQERALARLIRKLAKRVIKAAKPRPDQPAPGGEAA
jgi:8-oxo-dGTP pyrophosphatase MutT (NUDIX family)